MFVSKFKSFKLFSILIHMEHLSPFQNNYVVCKQKFHINFDHTSILAANSNPGLQTLREHPGHCFIHINQQCKKSDS